MEPSSSGSSSEPGFHAQVGEVLAAHPHKYIVEQFLPSCLGSFSKVAKCKILETNRFVAVKVVRQDQGKAGRREAEILEELRQLHPDTHTLLRLSEHFTHRNNLCLVFELLDMDLFAFMERRDFEPLQLCEIRPVAQQMLVALDALRDAGVVHTEVRPENILLVQHHTQPLKVKLAGFGHACVASSLRGEDIPLNYAYVAPEVLLDQPSLGPGVDVWSLGCVLAFLFLSEDLFPFDCEYEAMRMMVQLNYGWCSPGFLDGCIWYIHGLLNASRRTTRFFYQNQEGPYDIWRMKPPDQYTLETGNHIMDHCGFSKDCFCLGQVVLRKIKPRNFYLREDCSRFAWLLHRMLEMDPGIRIRPDAALSEDFITMRHLPLQLNDPYVTGTLERMKVCHAAQTNSS